MENHHDRPEILAAFRGEFGYARRESSTLEREMLYGAMPLPAMGSGPLRAVVRVAAPASLLRETMLDSLLALRIFAGISVSAAILLSLVAALFVSRPLRHMRDAARAFAEARWVTIRRVRTRDELEELSLALEELGKRLRAQLIEVGAQE